MNQYISKQKIELNSFTLVAAKFRNKAIVSCRKAITVKVVHDMPSPENRPKRPPEARKSAKNTANTQQVRVFKLYFDFNVFSSENG